MAIKQSFIASHSEIGTATFFDQFINGVILTFAFTNSENLWSLVLQSTNIMFIFIISICILPIFASFSKKNLSPKHLDRKIATGMLKFIVYNTENRRTWIYLSTVGLIFVSLVGLYKIEATGNLWEIFQKMILLVQT